MSDKTISIRVTRFRPEEEDAPTEQVYQVPYQEDWVVLDALNYIKDHVDGTLSYRWSCRMGVCGSCGMMVNGEPKLTCATFLKDYYPNEMVVQPLANFPIVRDLVVDVEDFMAKLKSVKPYIVRDDVNDTADGEYRQTPAELARYKQFSMCINCMLCYAACPVMGGEPEFVGPAALALAHRYNRDSRDRGGRERLKKMMEHEAVWGCTFVGACAEVCPKNVDPAGAIQQAKTDAAKEYFRSFFMPKGGR